MSAWEREREGRERERERERKRGREGERQMEKGEGCPYPPPPPPGPYIFRRIKSTAVDVSEHCERFIVVIQRYAVIALPLKISAADLPGWLSTFTPLT